MEAGEDVEGDEDEEQKAPHHLQPRVWVARQADSTAGRAALSATTAAQGADLKKMGTKMWRQRRTK